ncbi:phosphoribosyl-ATP diphosphatase [Nitzschia inconspicua]|uniref:phosphoribosyl-ATP diphosphatase n=1 Tax=Nitzschia inconspicua TaxID=303405 RepID=A0A9K3M4H3_9STRA|nr:phosphoribosyl-ATP diphosphatase [Nitzschia inconspicua]
MTSLPFPSFANSSPTDGSSQHLSASGCCRISPQTCSSAFTDDYLAICAKNKEQALVDDSIEDKAAKDEAKKLKKKYMKQGMAMASKYLQETSKLDVSIVDVQVVIEPAQIIQTDGCVCACFLDAGCASIVIDGSNLEALDAAKIPKERVVATFDGSDLDSSAIEAALGFASTVSVRLPTGLEKEKLMEIVNQVLTFVPSKSDKVIFELLHPTSSAPIEELTDLVAEISKKCKDGKGSIALIDPTAFELGMSYAACMKTDREDGLYTTVVCTRAGEALGLVYSSKESIVAALECGRGVYYSRSRNGLWRKGDTSGHYQTLHRLDVDCDGDALRFTVTQRGDDTAAFCHLNTLTCWGEPCGLRHLEGTLRERLQSAPEGSYTKRLFDDEELLRDKLVEEAQELSEATEPNDVAGELADVLYFAMVRAIKAGVSIDDAIAELDRRTRKVTRRKGDSKAFRIAAGNEILGKTEK